MPSPATAQKNACWHLPMSPLETSDGSADVNGVAGNSWATNKSARAWSTAVAFYPRVTRGVLVFLMLRV